MDVNLNVMKSINNLGKKWREMGLMLKLGRPVSPAREKERLILKLIRSTFKREQFDKSIEPNRANWLKFHHPENCPAKAAADTLSKTIESTKTSAHL